jgi:hypothetical protein
MQAEAYQLPQAQHGSDLERFLRAAQPPAPFAPTAPHDAAAAAECAAYAALLDAEPGFVPASRKPASTSCCAPGCAREIAGAQGSAQLAPARASPSRQRRASCRARRRARSRRR